MAKRRPIPPRLHSAVIRICADLECPPYWWEMPYKGIPAPTDWKVARAIVVGLADLLHFTRDDLGMYPNHWLAAKGLWEDFSDFEKQIYREVSGLQAQDFRDTIKPEGC